MRQHLMILLLSSFMLHCMQTELKTYPPPDMSVEVDATVSADDSDMSMPSNVIGQACDDQDPDNPCVGKQCITKSFLEGLGLVSERIEVQNGMCSMLNCQSDEDCGEQGVCFNTQPLSGLPVKICLAACKTLIDCRWQENYSCFNVQDFDDTAEDDQVCLPDGIAAEIYCGSEEGICDEAK